MSNWFTKVLGSIGHWFEGFFKAIGGQLRVSATQFLHDFVKDDLGKLAIDAVTWVQAQGLHSVAARDEAAAKFIADAEAAGHDVATFAASTVNWFIETALQAVKAEAGGGTPSQPPTHDPQ